jgi:G patch domain-containing protein 1
MDIFKAIFASDDDDSDDDAEEGGGQEKGAPAPTVPDPGPSTLTKRPEEEQPADVKSVPAHLRTTHSTADQTPTYEPRSVDRPPAGIDTATFKPVFVPRAERETQKTTGDKRDGTSRGKDNKKRAARAIVSFEEDDGAALVIAPQAADKDKDKDKDKSRRKKKRRKEKGSANAGGPGEEEDAEMWVEKVPPQVVASFVTTGAPPPPPPPEKEVRMTGADPLSAESTSAVRVAEGPSRGRKRAIDFL